MDRFVRGIFISIFCCLVSSFGWADERGVPEINLRTAILVKLPRMIYWSAESDFNNKAIPFRLCIFQDRDYYRHVLRNVSGKVLSNKKIEVVYARDIDDMRGCHVAFVGEVPIEEIRKIVESGLLNETIFVASTEGSAEAGIHIRLYVGANQRTRFELNERAFKAGRHEPSVQFIKLAERIYAEGGSR
ncbi:YfiR/HmsC family protein [Pleionea sp. CnH1-48]|uniref:YfiR family protein n=1 Tax=Pleionea sp. CnH1-48 TaxID=2954494 RepID=UPI0020969679|nr:YfiR family protein [Pleionea sp. CnH1-48]